MLIGSLEHQVRSSIPQELAEDHGRAIQEGREVHKYQGVLEDEKLLSDR